MEELKKLFEWTDINRKNWAKILFNEDKTSQSIGLLYKDIFVHFSCLPGNGPDCSFPKPC